MQVLVVAAHPDDEVLGFGGTGAALARQGAEVTAAFLASGVRAREGRPDDEQLRADTMAAQDLLGFREPIFGDFPNLRLNAVAHVELVKFVEEILVQTGATMVVTHHPADLNDDHLQVSRATLAAARLYQRKIGVEPLESLHFMEVLSSTDWAFPGDRLMFQPDTYADISVTIRAKIQALAAYRGVMRPAPHPRSEEVLRGHAAYRGSQAGMEYAEAFQTAFRRGLR